MMAPFVPFISEEIYRSLTGESVHVQSWPEASDTVIDPAGMLIKEIAAALRRYKSEKGMALNSPMPGIIIYSDMDLETVDLQGVANSQVESRRGLPDIEMRPIEVKPQMKILGPRFKDKSGKVIKALLAMNPGEVAEQKASDSIRISLDGEMIVVSPDSVEVITETLSAGTAVDVLKVGPATVLVRK